MTQIINIRNEGLGFSMDLMDSKWLIREYCEQLWTHKLDNLGEINYLFERHYLSKLMQEKIDNLILPISIKEIESVINNLPKQKAQSSSRCTREFYKH